MEAITDSVQIWAIASLTAISVPHASKARYDLYWTSAQQVHAMLVFTSYSHTDHRSSDNRKTCRVTDDEATAFNLVVFSMLTLFLLALATLAEVSASIEAIDLSYTASAPRKSTSIHPLIS